MEKDKVKFDDPELQKAYEEGLANIKEAAKKFAKKAAEYSEYRKNLDKMSK